MLIFFSCQQQESSSIEPRSNSSLPQSSLSSRSPSQLLQKQTLVNKTTKNECSQTFKKNKSAQKIKNSYLQKQLQFRVMTKVKAIKAGIFKATKRVRLGNGYKLIDTSILANSISKFSACKSCKKTDCFDIKEDCKLKRGLFETLILSC